MAGLTEFVRNYLIYRYPKWTGTYEVNESALREGFLLGVSSRRSLLYKKVRGVLESLYKRGELERRDITKVHQYRTKRKHCPTCGGSGWTTVTT